MDIFMFVIAVVALIFAGISAYMSYCSSTVPAKIAADERREARQYDFYIRPRAEAIEHFLSVASIACFQTQLTTDYLKQLLGAFGCSSFYVTEETRQLMQDFCDHITLRNADQNVACYKKIVLRLQSEPPRYPLVNEGAEADQDPARNLARRDGESDQKVV